MSPPRSKSGRAWKAQFGKCTTRLYELKKIIHNVMKNYDLEECIECGNLKHIDEECKECGNL